MVAPYQPVTGAGAAGLYWTLTLDQRAVTLSTVAPYDTIRLTAVARDQHGTALSGLGPVTFQSKDPEFLQVTPDGAIRALKVGTGLVVVAELVVGNVHHLDSLFVNITDDSAPPVVAHVLISSPDSNAWAVGGAGALSPIGGDGNISGLSFKFLFGSATDSGNTPIPGIAISYSSSDTTVARVVGPGGTLLLLTPVKPGRVNLIATAIAYGVTVADTIPFKIIMPVYGVVKIMPGPLSGGGTTPPVFGSREVTVSPGGTVLWANLSGQPVDVIFDDPTSVLEHGVTNCGDDVGGVGSIPAFGEVQDPAMLLSAANCRSRRFALPGTYPYHSALTGATGRVVVTDGLSTTSNP